MRATLLAALVLGLSAPAAAQINVSPSDDLEAALTGLSPGDEVILADGTYTVNERFTFTATGTAAMPIVVRAADGASPHVVQTSGQNIWDIQAEHVVIRGIEFSGGSAGLRFESASDVTVEDCEIHDTGDVALRFNQEGQTYRNIQILRNHIHDTTGTGEGMYLGCNGDTCRMADCVVQGNYVHHTTGSQGDGIELKPGSYGCVIADNVVHDSDAGYPCITGYSTAGNGAVNIIERNVVWSCGSHGIQWTNDAIIRNNIILFGADNGGLSIQPNAGHEPQNLDIVHNTVLAPSGDAIPLRGVVGRVLVANNAVYAQSGRAIFVRDTHPSLTIVGNVGEGSTAGFSGGFTASSLAVDLAGASYSGTIPNDVFPRAGGGLIAAGDAAHVPALDFNGTDRAGVADVGAYAYGSGTNPGWTIAAEPKPEGEATPTRDGGPPTRDAGAPTRDGGGVARDAGSAGGDASVAPRRDGGGSGSPDAGGGGPDDGGCSCRAARAGRAPAWLALPLALLWLRRRAG